MESERESNKRKKSESYSHVDERKTKERKQEHPASPSELASHGHDHASASSQETCSTETHTKTADATQENASAPSQESCSTETRTKTSDAAQENASAPSQESCSMETSTKTADATQENASTPSQESSSLETLIKMAEAAKKNACAPSQESCSVETHTNMADATKKNASAPSQESCSTETCTKTADVAQENASAPSQESSSFETLVKMAEAAKKNASAPSQESCSTETHSNRENATKENARTPLKVPSGTALFIQGERYTCNTPLTLMPLPPKCSLSRPVVVSAASSSRLVSLLPTEVASVSATGAATQATGQITLLSSSLQRKMSKLSGSFAVVPQTSSSSTVPQQSSILPTGTVMLVNSAATKGARVVSILPPSASHTSQTGKQAANITASPSPRPVFPGVASGSLNLQQSTRGCTGGEGAASTTTNSRNGNVASATDSTASSPQVSKCTSSTCTKQAIMTPTAAMHGSVSGNTSSGLRLLPESCGMAPVLTRFTELSHIHCKLCDKVIMDTEEFYGLSCYPNLTVFKGSQVVDGHMTLYQFLATFGIRLSKVAGDTSKVCKGCFDGLSHVYSESALLSDACINLQLLVKDSESRLGKALWELLEMAETRKPKLETPGLGQTLQATDANIHDECTATYFLCPIVESEARCCLCNDEFALGVDRFRFGNPPGEENILVMDMLQKIGVQTTGQQFAMSAVCLFCRNAVWRVFSTLKRLTQAKADLSSRLCVSDEVGARLVVRLKTYTPPILHSLVYIHGDKKKQTLMAEAAKDKQGAGQSTKRKNCSICNKQVSNNKGSRHKFCKLSNITSHYCRKGVPVAIADVLRELAVAITKEDAAKGAVCNPCEMSLGKMLSSSDNLSETMTELQAHSNESQLPVRELCRKLELLRPSARLANAAPPQANGELPSPSNVMDEGEGERCSVCITRMTEEERLKAADRAAQTRDLWKKLGVPVSPEEQKVEAVCGSCFGTLESLWLQSEALSGTVREVHVVASKLQSVGKRLCEKLELILRYWSEQLADRGVNTRRQASSGNSNPRAQRRALRDKLLTTATNLIRGYQYGRLVKPFYEQSDLFRKGCLEAVIRDIRGELSDISDPARRSVWRPGGQRFDKARRFTWKAALKEAKRDCPTLFKVVKGVATPARLRRNEMRMPPIALIIGLFASLYRPRSMNLLGEIIGLELYLSGCNFKAMKRLNNLGLCMFPDILSYRITALVKADEVQIRRKIRQVESLCLPSTGRSTGEPAPSPPAFKDLDLDSTLALLDAMQTGREYSPPKKRKNRKAHLKALPEQKTCEDPSCGYTIAFGDVEARTQSLLLACSGPKERGTMVHAYVAVDRIPCMHLGEQRTISSRELLKKLEPKNFLPQKRDTDLLRREYSCMIQKILYRRLPCLQPFEDEIKHVKLKASKSSFTAKYTEESQKKSEVIPVGYIHKVSATKDEEMAEILETLQKYVPGVPNATDPLPTILFGNTSSCRGVRAAQHSRASEGDRWDRLEGLRPSAQEWQKHSAYVEETFKLLYDARSCLSVGTLASIRERFDDNVLENVLQSTEHAADLLQFATEAYVIAAACVVMSLDDPAKNPNNLNRKKEGNRRRYLQAVADAILVLMAHPSSTEKAEEEGAFCICKTYIEDEHMVRCGNGSCRHGTWFHLSCLDLHHDDIPEEDWYCCEECSRNPEDGESSATAMDDLVNEYAKVLMYRGLGEMVRNEAMSENYGDRMIAHWRLDLPTLFQGEHRDIVREGVWLLADIDGAPPRVAHQLQWNRTVNPSGGAGQNVPLDRYMEDLTHELKRAVGPAGVSQQFLSKGVRLAHMLDLRREIEENFDNAAPRTTPAVTLRKMAGRKEDTLELAKMLLDQRCLDVIPGRSLEGLDGFKARNQEEDTDDFLVEVGQIVHEWKQANLEM